MRPEPTGCPVILADMNLQKRACRYLNIQAKGDPAAEAQLLMRHAHRLGVQWFLLQTLEDPGSIRANLLQTADEVQISLISRDQFFSITRERLGYAVDNPDLLEAGSPTYW